MKGLGNGTLISMYRDDTTPAIRQAADRNYELVPKFNLVRRTIPTRKWLKHDAEQEVSHTKHWLQTTLNAGQGELVIYLRTPR